MQVSYAIIFVSDMKQSVSFYRDHLGLRLKFESPEWTEFEAGGAGVALHISKKRDSGKDTEPVAGRCRPGFSVPDLDLLHRRLKKAGVTCIREPEETFGVRMAQYLDPDGLAVSISEAKSGN
jgi:lactoylglutathione lyase